MRRLSNDELNHIRTSVDIVDIVSDYIPLTKRGKNYFGVCPFHEDSDPSLSVSQDKQIFSCFSCHTSGNAFNFVKEYEHVSFIEAVKIIANKAGIPLDIELSSKNNDSHSTLYNAYDLSHKFYQNNLNTVGGKTAKEYLIKRSIDDDLIKEFEIGLALKSRDVLSRLLVKKNVDEKTLLESGLVDKRDGELVDLFRGRIMFPITDINGKVVGYSGRVYDTADTSKYINTKETAIFKKGEILYNYYKAKNECRLKDTVIITEGFMDVIRLYSIGVKNVIATMGTAITKKHISLIKRLAHNVILLFDGDKAGAKATLACANMLAETDLNVKVIRLEENLDPDEYILKKGKQSFLDKLENPISVLNFKLDYYKQGKDLTDDEQLSQYIKQVIDELSIINDDILTELTLKKLSVETNLDYEFLKAKVISKPVDRVIHNNPVVTYDKYVKAEIGLIHYMLLSPEVIKIYDNQTFYLPDQKYRILAKEISAFYEQNGYIEIADLMNELDEEMVKTIGEIESNNLSDNYNKQLIMDYINSIRENNIDQQIARIENKMINESDESKKIALLQQLLELKRRSEENA